MSSDLKVTNIKHESSSSNNLVLASDGNVSITNAITSGTFKGSLSEVPNIYQTTLVVPGSDWNADVTGTTETSVGAYVAWQNKKASSTVYVEISAFTAQSANGGSTSLRYGRYAIYKSLSAVADGATSGLGTKIAAYLVGRTTGTTTSNGNKGYQASQFITQFTSESSVGTNHYIGMAIKGDGSVTRVQLVSSASGTGDVNPVMIRITEIA